MAEPGDKAMNSTKTPKPINDDIRTLQADELDAVNGGFGMLQDAVTNALKSIGEGLSTMARKG